MKRGYYLVLSSFPIAGKVIPPSSKYPIYSFALNVTNIVHLLRDINDYTHLTVNHSLTFKSNTRNLKVVHIPIQSKGFGFMQKVVAHVVTGKKRISSDTWQLLCFTENGETNRTVLVSLCKLLPFCIVELMNVMC